MDLFKEEWKQEKQDFKALGGKSLRKNLRVLDQTGKTNKARDCKRKALAAGKRISKNGKVYWETRKNRSDAVGKCI